tara:strand:- start:284 stop:1816 length:1533 start_codon:yes stop_codon:yes gene_type:complete
LLAKKYRFYSKSDTEVLLNLYIEFKENCLELLEGMFSFLIFDNLEKTVFIARDKFGIKPLYYVLTSKKNLIFASELKAFIPFIKEEKLNWKLNQKKLGEQLKFRCLVGNETLINDVKKLNPGEYIKGNLKNISFRRYYDSNNLNYKQNLIFKKKRDIVDYLEDNLKKSIKEQSISDAPIGVALSGGLDSSLIINYLSEIKNNIKTYSINFEKQKKFNNKINESKYIKYIQEKYSTNHKSAILSEKIYKNIFLKCIWHNEEPINFPHTPGIFLLSNLAKQDGTKVLLGGEGADEFFGGYLNFLNKKLNYNFFQYSNFKMNDTVLKNFSNNFKSRVTLINKVKKEKAINKKILYSISAYLQSIENRLDKMSMANSIEFRVPFIKEKLLNISLHNNSKLIIKNKKFSKQILREIAIKYFKKEHVYRPKIGFSTPINTWIRNKNGFGEFIEILNEKRTLDREIYNSKNIVKLMKNFYKYPNENPNNSYAGKIWNILNLELWIRTIIEKKAQLND